MEAKDVLNLSWHKVRDWSELSASEEDCREKHYVCETDVNVFVENIYRDISRRLNIPYEQLKPVLIAENGAFYTLKKRLFKRTYYGYDKRNAQLIELQNTLRVPDISDVEDNVSICLKMFEDLSDMEKMIFLQKIGRIKIKVKHIQTEETE